MLRPLLGEKWKSRTNLRWSNSIALDSIKYAVVLVVWKNEHRDDDGRLKRAVQAVAHGIELLLKERLRHIHPALLWENVDRYPSLDARTVGAEALKKL